jgi:hypothetical protein
MKLPLRTELQELLKENGAPCVSLFMPTYRTSSSDRRQGPRLLENLLDEATDRLVERRLRRSDSEAMLERARSLAKDVTYWQNGLTDGLAVFVSPKSFREYKVPLALDERLYVDDGFHIAPLLPLYSGDTRFYILAISQNQVRLLEGNRHEVYEIEPKGLPRSLVDALQKVATAEVRPGQLHDDRHDQLGHGTGLEHVNQRLERYFREIDTNLLNLIGGDQAPLVLAGVERNVSLYRQVTSYKRVPEGVIDGNPELMSAKQLHAQAVAIVEPFLRKQEEIARHQLDKLGGTGRVSTDPREIIPAAQRGRIDSLFLQRGHKLWGSFDRSSDETQLHDGPADGAQELASLAAEQTFLNGGAVFFCDEKQLPRQLPMTALLRY